MIAYALLALWIGVAVVVLHPGRKVSSRDPMKLWGKARRPK